MGIVFARNRKRFQFMTMRENVQFRVSLKLRQVLMQIFKDVGQEQEFLASLNKYSDLHFSIRLLK